MSNYKSDTNEYKLAVVFAENRKLFAKSLTLLNDTKKVSDFFNHAFIPDSVIDEIKKNLKKLFPDSSFLGEGSTNGSAFVVHKKYYEQFSEERVNRIIISVFNISNPTVDHKFTMKQINGFDFVDYPVFTQNIFNYCEDDCKRVITSVNKVFESMYEAKKLKPNTSQNNTESNERE